MRYLEPRAVPGRGSTEGKQTKMIRSRNGRALLETEFDGRDKVETLRASGFAWDKAKRVWVRFTTARSSSVLDALRVGALTLSVTGNQLVLKPRVRFATPTWSALHHACRAAKLFWKGASWIGQIDDPKPYVDAYNEPSEEDLERQRRGAKEEADDAAVDAVRDAKSAKRAAALALEIRSDESYKRRCRKYGQLLIAMHANGAYGRGADGAPHGRRAR